MAHNTTPRLDLCTHFQRTLFSRLRFYGGDGWDKSFIYMKKYTIWLRCTPEGADLENWWRAVNIWRDRWLLSKPNQQQVEQASSRQQPELVSALIDPYSRRWRGDVIAQLLNSENAAAIVEIPLSKTPTAYLRAWHLEQIGIFTVRSMYRYGIQEKRKASEGADEESNLAPLWDAIWHMNIPSKIQIFLWRCAHDILPTRQKLRNMKMPIDTTCPRYPETQEETIHAIWRCSKSAHV